MMEQKMATYNIMVVEDDVNMVEFYKTSLETIIKQKPYIFSFTSVSDELFKTVKENTIDLFVIDIHLGKYDGIELSSQLLKEVDSATFLFISGFDYTYESFENLDGKCIYDFMLKPISVNELAIRSKGLLNVSRSFNSFLKHVKNIEGEYINLKLGSLRDRYFDMVKQDRYMIQELKRQVKTDHINDL